MRSAVPEPTKGQTDKFREAAREPECDDDEQRFQERVRKLVKHKPVDGSPEEKAGWEPSQ